MPLHQSNILRARRTRARRPPSSFSATVVRKRSSKSAEDRRSRPRASFFRFRNRFLGGFKSNLGMRAVTKRFLGRSAAAAKRHARFDRKFVAVTVDQFHIALHD